MGNRKQKWTSEEEAALRAGVAKHGAGRWKKIEKDPDFSHLFNSRSNIDLKDKWRNLNMSDSNLFPRDKTRTSKPNTGAIVAIVPATQTRPSSEKSSEDDLSKSFADQKLVCKPKYSSMIFDALSTLKEKEPNGLNTSAIVRFIEQKYDVPQNFRRLISSSLRRLVTRDKLEKVQNGFKIKDDRSIGTQILEPKQKENMARPSQGPCHLPSTETAEEASQMAAYKIAEAENKSFLAAEGIKEAERVSRMSEDAHSLLKVAEAIFEKFKAQNPPLPISCCVLESYCLPLVA